MARSAAKCGAVSAEAFPPLPLSPDHWQRVVKALGLSERQAQITELILRDLSRPEIAAVMEIAEPTIETHLQRIGNKTGARGKMRLAMLVLEVSHEVARCCTCQGEP